MDSLALIKRLLAQREFKVELAPGLSVTVRRPAEAEVLDYFRKAQSRDADAHLACVVDWHGFSESVWLGAAIGSSDPLDFDQALWMQVARDRGDWIVALAEAIGNAITEHGEKRKATAKNSTPSSTRKAALSGRAKTGH